MKDLVTWTGLYAVIRRAEVKGAVLKRESQFAIALSFIYINVC
jgi:hypothetical protein